MGEAVGEALVLVITAVPAKQRPELGAAIFMEKREMVNLVQATLTARLCLSSCLPANPALAGLRVAASRPSAPHPLRITPCFTAPLPVHPVLAGS